MCDEEDSLDDMGVLALGDTISEHDDFLRKGTGFGLEPSEVVRGHVDEISDDLPINRSVGYANLI